MGLREPTLIGNVPDDQLEQSMPFIHEQSRRKTGFILRLSVCWCEELLPVVIFYMLTLVPAFIDPW